MSVTLLDDSSFAENKSNKIFLKAKLPPEFIFTVRVKIAKSSNPVPSWIIENYMSENHDM